MAKRYKTTTQDATIESAVEDGKSMIEELSSEMGEWRDNIEEHFGGTEKFERVSEAADALEGCGADCLDVPGAIEEHDALSALTFKVSQSSPYGRKSEPRWMRLGNATSFLDTARSELESFLDDLPEDDKNADLRSELEDFVREVEGVVDELSAVDFPSMFG